MKNNSLGTKLLMAVVTLVLLAYFGVQGYQYFNDPLSTTLTYDYLVEDSVSLTGYVVRDEQVLPAESSGLLRLTRSEGERVSTGGAVATVYADQTSLDRQTEIDSLTERIEQLQYAQEAALGVEVTQKLDAQIEQSILAYRAAVTAERFQDAEQQGSSLRSQVMKRDYSLTGTEDLEAQLADLEAQKKSLQSQAANSVRKVTVSSSGLYSAVVDGYETVLTPDSLTSLTPSQLSGVQADASVSSNVGKLIRGEYWYYAATMTASAAKDLQERQAGGTTLYLRFTKNVERDLEVTLTDLGPEENGRVVAVFRGSTYLSQLTLLRQQSAQVIYGSVEGLRIPREALRVLTSTTENEDGTTTQTKTTGVYCVVGLEARFKPVNILYSGEHFLLVEAAGTTSSEVLRLRSGDEVILQAKDLFDGKVVG